jgi:prolyl oligopeptidase
MESSSICRCLFLPTLALLLVSPARLRAAEPAAAGGEADPYQWLEEIGGDKPLEWVRAHDDATAKRLQARPEYNDLYRDALTVLNSASRIPQVEQRGSLLYNFWRDEAHPRGIYRRVSLEGFRAASPEWETVLDVDALAKSEGKPWAFGGTIWPTGDSRRGLLLLSVAGGDTVEVREFDFQSRAFVPNGFTLPAAKSRVAWLDGDHIFVATDFGPKSLTTSGYPAQVRIWRRGTPLAEASPLYAGATTSVGVSARAIRMKPGSPDLILVAEDLTFWERKYFQYVGGSLVPLTIPATARVVDGWGDSLVIELKSPWRRLGHQFSAGSVVLVPKSRLQGGDFDPMVPDPSFDLLAAPTPTFVIEAVQVTAKGIYVSALDNVRGRLFRLTPGPAGWQRAAIEFPDNGAVAFASTDDDSGDAWVEYQSFLSPPSLYYIAAASTVPEPVKAQAPTFDAARFEVEQLSAVSADGTPIPYFVVQAKGAKRDGTAPTWMFSYGGFENSLTPSYSGSYEDLHGAYGKLWLERGGVFVLANIRGGGEFGPAWHQGALNENHYKAFEDFEAVARDLAVRRITSPAHLGIEGRSNGGLLVSATMLRHPELYGAVVCGNPLVDMRRYHLLLAGASWMGEYGNPDRPEQWEFIRKYSPYQNIRAGMKLPPILFYTTTHDDRVHPGHARKMAAKMEALGYSFEYAENTEGGHHGSVTNEQLATRLATTYTFLWEHVR